jgi:hypothetical protein
VTLFEYLTAAVSIVLALAVVRLVEGLRPALGPGRFWVHWGWVIGKIVSCLVFWWILWGVREQVAWNFPYFAFVFVGPIIIYVQASILVPHGGNVVSWREHFLSVHRPFYVAQVLYLLHLIAISRFIGEVLTESSTLMAFITIGFGLLASAVGAISAGVRVQQGVAVILFALVAIGATIFFFNPA